MKQPDPIPASCKSPLPEHLLSRLASLSQQFTRPTWQNVLLLMAGAILAPGKRTVTAALRILGREQENDFPIYHGVLNRAVWSSRAVAGWLLRLLVASFVGADATVVIGIDDTIERRWGHKISARGIYRDPVRSSKGHFVKTSGLRWLSAQLLVHIPWAGRIMGLPFLTVLAPSKRFYAETLLWHLGAFDAGLIQDLFSVPPIRPFSLLIAALRADRRGLGAAREAARRRQGVGGALRQARQNAQARSRETVSARAAREQRALANRPSDRFALSRLFDGAANPRVEPQSRDQLDVAVAVYTVIGWRERDGDPLGGAGWTPALLQNRYIRLWLFRHRHLAAETLIAALADAVAAAPAQDRGIVLPELTGPMTDALPVRLAVQTGRDRPARPGAPRGAPDG